MGIFDSGHVTFYITVDGNIHPMRLEKIKVYGLEHEWTIMCVLFWNHLQTYTMHGPAHETLVHIAYSKTCVKWPLSKRQKICFQDQLSNNAGQKYCRMLQGEHSAILSTFIKLQFVIKIFVLSIFWVARFTPVLLYKHNHYSDMPAQLPCRAKGIFFLFDYFIIFHTLCMRAAKAMMRLHRCTVLS